MSLQPVDAGSVTRGINEGSVICLCAQEVVSSVRSDIEGGLGIGNHTGYVLKLYLIDLLKLVCSLSFPSFPPPPLLSLSLITVASSLLCLRWAVVTEPSTAQGSSRRGEHEGGVTGRWEQDPVEGVLLGPASASFLGPEGVPPGPCTRQPRRRLSALGAQCPGAACAEKA